MRYALPLVIAALISLLAACESTEKADSTPESEVSMGAGEGPTPNSVMSED